MHIEIEVVDRQRPGMAAVEVVRRHVQRLQFRPKRDRTDPKSVAGSAFVDLEKYHVDTWPIFHRPVEVHGKPGRHRRTVKLWILIQRHTVAARIQRSRVEHSIEKPGTPFRRRRTAAGDLGNVRAVTREVNQSNADQPPSIVDHRSSSAIHRQTRQGRLPVLAVDGVPKHLRLQRHKSRHRDENRHRPSREQTQCNPVEHQFQFLAVR